MCRSLEVRDCRAGGCWGRSGWTVDCLDLYGLEGLWSLCRSERLGSDVNGPESPEFRIKDELLRALVGQCEGVVVEAL